MKKFIQIASLLVLAVVAVSCSKYNRILKSADIDLKYEYAVKYYLEEEYNKALPLMEEIIPLFRGSEKSEILNFYYAYSNYHLGEYILAGYHFEKFYNIFPNSEHSEEAMFMCGYCYYLLSPVYSLDQENTLESIDQFKKFRNTYPTSSLADSALNVLNGLNLKLEKKAFENAKLYVRTENYKAAVRALTIFQKDHPNTIYDKEVHYLILKSSYLLAMNSIQKKKEERINDTIDAYYNFVDNFVDEKYLKESEEMYDLILKERDKLITQQ